MKVDAAASSIRFVYPFSIQRSDFAESVERVAAQRWGDGSRPLWEDHQLDSADFLPHLARYFQSSAVPPMGRLWHLQREARQSNEGLAASCQWSLELPGSGRDRRLSFSIDGVDLAVFAVGIGFVTTTVSARAAEGRGASADPDDWLDLMHHFRFAAPRRGVTLVIERGTGRDTVERFAPPAFCGSRGGGDLEFQRVLDWLCDGVAGDALRGEREIFAPGQMLPFATLYVDDAPVDEIPLIRHRVRHFFHSRQRVHPSAEDLRDDHPFHVTYARDQWFLFSIEGGAFVAFDAPAGFFRETMPGHVARQYFLLFLIALHQRFALLLLSDAVARYWPTRREAEMERIRDRLLLFTARGHFAHVMQHENHHRCYRTWQEVLGIRALYEEVHDEVTEMNQHLTMKRTEEVESRLHLLGLLSGILGFPGLTFAYLQIVASPKLAWWQTLGLGVATSLLGALLMPHLFRWWARSNESADSEE